MASSVFLLSRHRNCCHCLCRRRQFVFAYSDHQHLHVMLDMRFISRRLTYWVECTSNHIHSYPCLAVDFMCSGSRYDGVDGVSDASLKRLCTRRPAPPQSYKNGRWTIVLFIHHHLAFNDYFLLYISGSTAKWNLCRRSWKGISMFSATVFTTHAKDFHIHIFSKGQTA